MQFDLALTLLIIGWAFVLVWVPLIIRSNRKIHPRALFTLFFAEMWERFSYYGMRAILTLYMAKVLFIDMGDDLARTKAIGIYGAYTAMVYLFPVLGGLVADKVFGFRKSILWGGSLMALGHFTLALAGIPALESIVLIFYLGLSLIIVGNGYFKPNISSFLGEFYDKDDARKDAAFSIFYMGVNVGSLLATLTCGYVAERINWHLGFGLAGIGMVLGLIVFWFAVRNGRFEDKGLEPDPEDARSTWKLGLSKNAIVYLGSLLFLPVVIFFLDLDTVLSAILSIGSLVVLGYFVFYAFTAKDKAEGQRLLVVAVLFFFHAVFWALFEQAGSSLTLFAESNVDRMVMGQEIPASQFQSLNPLFVIIFAPIMSWLWLRLNKAKKEPSTPMKFVLGLSQLALGFVVIVLGARFFADDGLVPIIFLAVMYLFHTTGELSLSPVGLSMVTKLAPGKIVGFVMGAWFLSISLANSMAGQIGKLTEGSSDSGAELSIMESLNQYSATYLTWGVGVVFGAAFLLLLLVPTLRRWMHGIH